MTGVAFLPVPALKGVDLRQVVTWTVSSLMVVNKTKNLFKPWDGSRVWGENKDVRSVRIYLRERKVVKNGVNVGLVMLQLCAKTLRICRG